MSTRVVGIDLREEALHLVRLEVRGKAVVIDAYRHVPLPPLDELDLANDEGPLRDEATTPPQGTDLVGEEDAALREGASGTREELGAQGTVAARVRVALCQLVAEGWLDVDAVHVHMPAAQLFVERLALPFSQRRQIEAVLLPQLDGRLPEDIEELHLDFHVGASLGDGHPIWAVALPGRAVEDRLRVFQEAGIEPRLLDAGPFAWLQLFAPLTQERAQPLALVDISRSATSIVVFHRGQVTFLRTLASGTKGLAQALVESFGWSEEVAREELALRRLDGPAEHEEDPVQALLDARAQALLKQIGRSLRAHASQEGEAVESIYLVGDEAGQPGLADLLQRELGVEVVLPEAHNVPDAWRGLGEEPWRYLFAYALAMRALPVAGGSQFNLRRGPYAWRGDRAWLTERLPTLGAWAAAFVGALLLWAGGNALQISMEERRLEAALEQATTEVFGSPLLVPDRITQRLQSTSARPSFLPEMSAWDHFRAISGVIGDLQDEEAYELEARQIDVDLQRRLFDIRGEANSAESVEELAARLEGLRCLRQVTRNALSRSRSGEGFDFGLQGVASCATEDQERR